MLIERSSKDLSRSTYLAIPQLSVRIRTMSNVKTTRRRFAPLDPQKSNSAGAPPLKGIVFDVDGTLWYAFSSHDFTAMRVSDLAMSLCFRIFITRFNHLKRISSET